MMERSLLEGLEASIRAVGRRERTVMAQDHFEAYLSPSRAYLMSFAVPTLPNPHDWAPHVRALKAAFTDRERRPRLEYFDELHPGLAAALEEEGFACDMRAAVMVLTPAQLGVAGPAVEADFRRLDADDEDALRAYLRRQSVAYGGGEGEEATVWLPNLVSGLRKGTVMTAALARDGAFVAGASIQIGNGIGELAGVWTDPALRRQGLAYAVCRRLLAATFAAGYELCWLSAVEDAQQLYRKLGFTPVGTQLNYGIHQPFRIDS